MILFIKNHIIWFPSVQHCNWFGFRISLSLSREGAIFRDEIENYFSCSRLARRDRDYQMTILVFRDENEIPFCYSHVSRRDRDFRKSFLVVEREKMKVTLVENSRDREFSLTSALLSLLPYSSTNEASEGRGTNSMMAKNFVYNLYSIKDYTQYLLESMCSVTTLIICPLSHLYS